MGQIEMRKLISDPCNQAFDCGIAGINDMIKRSYFPTILQHLYCFEVKVDGEIIGYYMYGFRKLKMEECPGETGEYFSDLSDVCYTLHLKYIAVASQYQHHGVGTKVLYLLIKQIFEMCKIWPVRLITLNALKERVDWYRSIGFKMFNELDMQNNDKDVQMYMDCLLDPDKVSEYCSTQI